MENLVSVFERLVIDGGVLPETVNKIRLYAIILAVIVSAVCIFAAFATKKARVLCFFTATFNSISLILTPTLIVCFNVTGKVPTFTGSSLESVQGQLNDYYIMITPYLFKMLLCSCFVLASFIFTLIYICKLMSVKPKVFGVFALILHILRYLFISPFPLWSMFVPEGATNASQTTAAIIYMIACVVPLLLLIGPAIFSLIKKPIKTEE